MIVVRKWVEGGYLTIREVGVGEKVRLEPFEEIDIDVGLLLGDDPEE
jgi:hypothetical protein